MTKIQQVKTTFDTEIGLADIVSLVRNHWYILFGSILIALGGSVYYSLSLQEIYRGSVLLVDGSENSQISTGSMLPGGLGGAVAGLAGFSLDLNSSSVDRTIAVLKSRKFAKSFLADNDLRPLLFPEDWNASKKLWIDTKPSELQFYRAFNSMLTTSTGTDGLITLGFEAANQDRVADVANMIVAYLNNIMRKEAIKEAEKSISFLEAQVGETSLVNSQSVLYSLIEQQTEKIMIASVREEYSFKVIDPAVRPDERISPNRTNIVLLACALGGLVGLAIIALVVALRSKVKETSRHKN